jgi:hypothetical protein
MSGSPGESRPRAPRPNWPCPGTRACGLLRLGSPKCCAARWTKEDTIGLVIFGVAMLTLATAGALLPAGGGAVAGGSSRRAGGERRTIHPRNRSRNNRNRRLHIYNRSRRTSRRRRSWHRQRTGKFHAAERNPGSGCYPGRSLSKNYSKNELTGNICVGFHSHLAPSAMGSRLNETGSPDY